MGRLEARTDYSISQHNNPLGLEQSCVLAFTDGLLFTFCLMNGGIREDDPSKAGLKKEPATAKSQEVVREAWPALTPQQHQQSVPSNPVWTNSGTTYASPPRVMLDPTN